MKVIGIWAATSIAIIVGIIITKNANCLWAFFVPALLSWDDGIK